MLVVEETTYLFSKLLLKVILYVYFTQFKTNDNYEECVLKVSKN